MFLEQESKCNSIGRVFSFVIPSDLLLDGWMEKFSCRYMAAVCLRPAMVRLQRTRSDENTTQIVTRVIAILGKHWFLTIYEILWLTVRPIMQV